MITGYNGTVEYNGHKFKIKSLNHMKTFETGQQVFVSNEAAAYYQMTGRVERLIGSCYEVKLSNGRYVTYKGDSIAPYKDYKDIFKQFNLGDIVRYQGLGILFRVHSKTDPSGSLTIGYFDSIAQQYLKLSVKAEDLELYSESSFESLIAEEAKRAVELHGQFNSLHEGYGVIKEEFDEVWDEIKKKEPDKEALKAEIIQTAAMLKKLYDYVEST